MSAVDGRTGTMIVFGSRPKAPGCWLAACFATCAVLALAAHALSPRGASLEPAAQLSPESASGCTFLMTADASDRGAGGRLAGELSAAIEHAVLAQDRRARLVVRAHPDAQANVVMLLGKVTAPAAIDYNALVRSVSLEMPNRKVHFVHVDSFLSDPHHLSASVHSRGFGPRLLLSGAAQERGQLSEPA